MNKWKVEVRQSDASQINSAFVDCLHYAGILQVVQNDESGYVVLIPVANEAAANGLAARMKTFGFVARVVKEKR